MKRVDNDASIEMRSSSAILSGRIVPFGRSNKNIQAINYDYFTQRIDEKFPR